MRSLDLHISDYGKNVIVKNDIGEQNARFLKGSLSNSTIEKGSIYRYRYRNFLYISLTSIGLLYI